MVNGKWYMVNIFPLFPNFEAEKIGINLANPISVPFSFF